MQVYVHLTHNSMAQNVDRLNNYLDDVKKLKLNHDKTEFITFDSKIQYEKVSSFYKYAYTVISVRKLGMWFYLGLPFLNIFRAPIRIVLLK